MKDVAWKPGLIVIGQYRLEKLLGQGGVGEVWQAEQLSLRRPVALKRLLNTVEGDPALPRLQREARTLAQLNHPSIVSIYDMYFDPGLAFISMEFIDGFDLGQLIANKSLHLGRQITIAVQASRGLLYAHSQAVLHRDIKPGNILISAPTGDAKLTDFGIATTLSDINRDTRLTQAGFILGTVAYMSPEQATGGEIDIRSDIFSMGATLYEFFTGVTPHAGPSHVATLMNRLKNRAEAPRLLRGEIPPRLDELLMDMLELESRNRPQSMGEVISVLQDLADSMPVSPWVAITFGESTNFGETTEAHAVTKIEKLSAPVGFFTQGPLRRTAFFANEEVRYTKIQETLQFYRDHLNGEYQNLMSQAKQTYLLWVICVVAGMVMLMAGVTAMLLGSVGKGIGVSVCSIVTYFIQKIFQQREDYFRSLARQKNTHLEYGNYWLLAIQSVDAVEDPLERAKQQVRLADVLAERLHTNPLA